MAQETYEHARPSQDSPGADVPEPSYAERARTLVHVGRVGTLSTISRKHAEWPFGSVAPYGLDEKGRPTFLISTMAMHTQNVLANVPSADPLPGSCDPSPSPSSSRRACSVRMRFSSS